ncbi:MAG: S8 family serine peptidase [Actinobacteria bacterium]|nr:S8 family serine peptidase [Actinomycetota bacterium]
MTTNANARIGTGRGPVTTIATTIVLALAAGLVATGTPAEAPLDLPTAVAAPAASVDPAIAAALDADGTVAVVVQVRDGDIAAVRELVTRHGGTVSVDLPIVDGFGATVTRDALAALADVPGITVTLDGEIDVSLESLLGSGDGGTTEESTGPTTPADTSYVQTIGAHRLHNKGVTGAGVGIAIIDTGVSEVGDLTGRIQGAVDLSGEGDHVDRFGHGTFIAGVAAGSGAASKGEHAGVAPGAHIVPVKIAGRDGSADVTHVLAGIQYVVSFKDDHDIGVLNLSLGTNSTQSWKTDPLNYAVQRAWDAGIVVVVSGANLGPGPQTVTKPADDPLVITLGAVDAHATSDRADDTMSDFSSRGPTASDGLVKPDLVAPGVSLVGLRAPDSFIDTNYPKARIDTAYFRGSGTSFSAAVVTGAAALLRQAHPDWTPDLIKGALMATAAPGPVGSPNVDGAGSVDVAAASKLSAPPVANVGVGRSDGTGALDLSRGDLQVEIVTEDVYDLAGNLISTVTEVLTGETTAQDLLFDREAYVLEWSKARWYETDWNKARWYKARWYDADWQKARWYATDWK